MDILKITVACIGVTLLSLPLQAATDCTVTSASGTGAGSFGEMLGVLNPPSSDCINDTIAFSNAVSKIEVSSIQIVSENAATINGGGDVSITTGAATGLDALLVVNTDAVTVQNLTITNTNPATDKPAAATGSGKKNCSFSSVSFSAAGTNIHLQEETHLVTQSNFTVTQASMTDVLGSSAASPLVSINPNGGSLTAPNTLTARLSASIGEWTLSGSVGAAANRVEIYTVDTTAKTVRFLAAATASSSAFSFTFTLPATLPNQTFAFLGMNNTTGSFQMSQFSSAFTPTTDDTAFYSDVPACANVTWLVATQGGLTGDFDGDGLSNGTEDADADCTVDSTETNPAATDTDGDTVSDGSDNCKTTSNLSQADADSNGTGDACTDTDSDGVFDDTDNCESTANASQADADADGIGDACEAGSTASETDTAGGGTTGDAGATDDSGAAASTEASDSGGGCSLIRHRHSKTG